MPQGYELLLRLLRRCVPHGASVTELYAGAGIVGISLAATRACRWAPLTPSLFALSPSLAVALSPCPMPCARAWPP